MELNTLIFFLTHKGAHTHTYIYMNVALEGWEDGITSVGVQFSLLMWWFLKGNLPITQTTGAEWIISKTRDSQTEEMIMNQPLWEWRKQKEAKQQPGEPWSTFKLRWFSVKSSNYLCRDLFGWVKNKMMDLVVTEGTSSEVLQIYKDVMAVYDKKWVLWFGYEKAERIR